jgi:hypothetical protein
MMNILASIKALEYEDDYYLLGHKYRVLIMDMSLDVLNARGDAKTRYEIEVQNISPIKEDSEEIFIMPYHDSPGVTIPVGVFDPQARTATGIPLDVKWIISSEVLKRFAILLPKLEFEETIRFEVTLNEPEMFGQQEQEDYYDLSYMYPTEKAGLRIQMPHDWRVETVWINYGESFRPVRDELTDIGIYCRDERDVVSVQLNRPKLSLMYLTRWKWRM